MSNHDLIKATQTDWLPVPVSVHVILTATPRKFHLHGTGEASEASLCHMTGHLQGQGF